MSSCVLDFLSDDKELLARIYVDMTEDGVMTQIMLDGNVTNLSLPSVTRAVTLCENIEGVTAYMLATAPWPDDWPQDTEY